MRNLIRLVENASFDWSRLSARVDQYHGEPSIRISLATDDIGELYGLPVDELSNAFNARLPHLSSEAAQWLHEGGVTLWGSRETVGHGDTAPCFRVNTGNVGGVWGSNYETVVDALNAVFNEL